MSERKATDILLKVEADMATLLAHLSNLDLKFTLILARLNKLDLKNMESQTVKSQLDETLIKKSKSSNVFQNAPNLAEKIQAAKVAAEKNQVEFIDQDQLDQDSSEQITVEKNPGPRRRGERKPDGLSPIPVQQKIVYDDGKVIFMATVEIFSGSELVKKTNTNQGGKWFVSLTPGTYTVSVKKTGSQQRTAVDLRYEITVPNQDSTVELETRKAE